MSHYLLDHIQTFFFSCAETIKLQRNEGKKGKKIEELVLCSFKPVHSLIATSVLHFIVKKHILKYGGVIK